MHTIISILNKIEKIKYALYLKCQRHNVPFLAVFTRKKNTVACVLSFTSLYPSNEQCGHYTDSKKKCKYWEGIITQKIKGWKIGVIDT
jgi:hypothetical protein